MGSSKCRYIIMMIIGSICTGLYVATLWANSIWDMIFNILAMLGSGVFCSALVSLIIETRNEIMLEQEHKRQRDYILSSFRNSVKSLIELELRCLSRYCLLLEAEDVKKTHNCKLPINTTIDKILDYLSQLRESVQMCYQYSNVIDSNYLKRIKYRNTFAYELTFSHYTYIQKSLEHLVYESNNYLIAGVLDEKAIKSLKDMNSGCVLVIESSHEDKLDLLFEYKFILFNEMGKHLKNLGFDLNEELNCSITVLQTNNQ